MTAWTVMAIKFILLAGRHQDWQILGLACILLLLIVFVCRHTLPKLNIIIVCTLWVQPEMRESFLLFHCREINSVIAMKFIGDSTSVGDFLMVYCAKFLLVLILGLQYLWQSLKCKPHFHSSLQDVFGMYEKSTFLWAICICKDHCSYQSPSEGAFPKHRIISCFLLVWTSGLLCFVQEIPENMMLDWFCRYKINFFELKLKINCYQFKGWLYNLYNHSLELPLSYLPS